MSHFSSSASVCSGYPSPPSNGGKSTVLHTGSTYGAICKGSGGSGPEFFSGGTCPWIGIELNSTDSVGGTANYRIHVENGAAERRNQTFVLLQFSSAPIAMEIVPNPWVSDSSVSEVSLSFF